MKNEQELRAAVEHVEDWRAWAQANRSFGSSAEVGRTVMESSERVASSWSLAAWRHPEWL
jgi:hypothetical protein